MFLRRSLGWRGRLLNHLLDPLHFCRVQGRDDADRVVRDSATVRAGVVAAGKHGLEIQGDVAVPMQQGDADDGHPVGQLPGINEESAPLIETVHGTAQVLSSLPDGRIVAAQQGKLLATSFHPELTRDNRFHRYFLELAR